MFYINTIGFFSSKFFLFRYRVTRIFITSRHKGFDHDTIPDAIGIVKVSTVILYMMVWR